MHFWSAFAHACFTYTAVREVNYIKVQPCALDRVTWGIYAHKSADYMPLLDPMKYIFGLRFFFFHP